MWLKETKSGHITTGVVVVVFFFFHVASVKQGTKYKATFWA